MVPAAVETAAAVAWAVGATQAKGPPAEMAAETGARRAREETESGKAEVGVELPAVAEA